MDGQVKERSPEARQSNQVKSRSDSASIVAVVLQLVRPCLGVAFGCFATLLGPDAIDDFFGIHCTANTTFVFLGPLLQHLLSVGRRHREAAMDSEGFQVTLTIKSQLALDIFLI